MCENDFVISDEWLCCCGNRLSKHTTEELKRALKFKEEVEDFEVCAQIRDEVKKRDLGNSWTFQVYNSKPCRVYN